MSAVPKLEVVTVAEYVAFDAAHDGRHELIDGEIVAMAGATREHIRVTQNVWRSLDRALSKRGCEAFIAELRVAVQDDELYAYPDVVVVCGDQQVTKDIPETLLNPTVLVEVLSPSTAARDRGPKATSYRNLATVTDVLLVDPKRRVIEHYRRLSPTEWHLAKVRAGVVTVQGVGVSLTVEEIFTGV